MKFRAEPKDILIFCIFCVFLLYLVALAVLNVTSLVNDNVFWGLNPFPAFSSEYIAPTMVFYLVALIAIFTSVQSYFFDREKGFGITTSKKDKGYSRWAKDAEMKKELKQVDPKADTATSAGIPLIVTPKSMWVDDGEYHSLVIGATGSGKTSMLVHSMIRSLAKAGESIIITDPKGEIYRENGEMLKEKGYNIVILNFRDPQKGTGWNPLALPYQLYKNGNKDKATELLEDLAVNILYDENSQKSDPFWEKTSADYFTGLALGLFEDATPEQINLNSINLMTTVGEDKFSGSTYIKEYFMDKDPASPAYVNAASTIMAPSETKGSIISVFKQKIKLFSSRENMAEMLSHSDFDMADIGRKKTAVFIIIQDEKKTYHPLATIFLKQCYETLIDVAQEFPKGKLPFRTNFILDEFANMPPLKDIGTMVSAARSRLIRFTFIIQNFAQLKQVYGAENAETIKGNCGNIIYLISTELSALEEISKMCGEVKSKEKEKTASVPLVTVSDLQRMQFGEVIIIRARMMPFKTKMTQYFKINWGRDYGDATLETREKEPLQLFDIREFVKNRKQAKLYDILNGNPPAGSQTSPFSGTDGGIVPPTSPLANNLDIPKTDTVNPEPQKATNNSFDIDSIVKRIDARLAELEEEERKEKEEEERKSKIKGSTYIEPKNNELSFDNIEDNNKENTMYISPAKEESYIPKSETANDVTDDQFFDDFFSDDVE